MKIFIFCIVSMLYIICQGVDMSKNNYYIETAILFNDINKVLTLQSKEIKITCLGIKNGTDFKVFRFNTSLNNSFTIVTDNNYYISEINDLKVPVPLLEKRFKNNEWIELSKLYFNECITKTSFLNFINIEIEENTSFDIIINILDDHSFSITSPLSHKKRVVRYSSHNLLQLRDYDGDRLLQEINFYPDMISIYRIYIIGKIEVTFFSDGGIQSLIEYDNKTKKAIQGKEWNKDGTLLKERDFIKNPINYNELKFIK